MRCGYWYYVGSLQSSFRSFFTPYYKDAPSYGFRVASVDDSWITNGLVAYYPFNGDFKDESISSNQLINYSASLGNDRFGENASALDVYTYSCVNSVRNIGISGNTQRTISIWVKILQEGYPNGCLLQWGQPSNGGGYQNIFLTPSFWNNHWGTLFWDASSDKGFGVTVASINYRDWHHVVLTYDNSGTKFYFDGLIQNSIYADKDSQIDTIDGVISINGNGNGITGTLDDIRIYNRALSSNEVAQLYALESTPPNLTWSDGFGYRLSGNSATIVAYNGTNSTVTIPSTIGGLPVTSIDENAFANQPGITSVVIPGSVTNIGSAAFSGCPNLTSVTLPDSVVNFGSGVFGNSPNVAVSASPGAIAYLAQNATALGFTGNALTSIQNGGTFSTGYEWIANWLLADPSFLSGLGTIFQVTPYAATSLSNSIAVQGASFSASLSNAVVSISGLSNSLGNTIASNAVTSSNSLTEASNALSGSIVSQVGSVSNGLTISIGNQVTGLSNALSGEITSQTTGVSNALATSLSTQGSSLSNALSNTLVTISGVSNRLSGEIASNAASFSSTLGTVSNTLSGFISSSTLSLSNALTGVVTEQGTSLSNTLSNSIVTLTAQTVGMSNALSGAIASSTASASTQISAVSNVLSTSIQNNTQALSTALSNAVAQLSAQTAPTNPAFVSAVAAQILAASNNYGMAVKQDQSLNFPTLPVQILPPGKPISLSVTSSANQGPILFTSGNTAVARVSNSQITILGAGSTTITASQAGNNLYNPVSASQTLVVNKGNQTLSFPAIPAQNYASGKTLTLRSTSSAGLTNSYLIDNGSIGSISNNVVTLLGTGTATITATNSGNAYFAPAFATRQLIVK